MKQGSGEAWGTVVGLAAIGVPAGLLSAYLFVLETTAGAGAMAFAAAALGVIAVTCLVGAVATSAKLLAGRQGR